jgi:hypothetical protein
MELPHFLPELGLGVSEKSPDSLTEQSRIHVPFSHVSAEPTRLIQQDGFNVGFEGFFVGLGHWLSNNHQMRSGFWELHNLLILQNVHRHRFALSTDLRRTHQITVK